MSGQAGAAKKFEWFQLNIDSQLMVSVTTMVHPDGSVSGPKEYFEGKKKNYTSWMN